MNRSSERQSGSAHRGLELPQLGTNTEQPKNPNPKVPCEHMCTHTHHTHTPGSVHAAVDTMDTHSQVLRLCPPPHAPAPLGWLGTRLESQEPRADGDTPRFSLCSPVGCCADKVTRQTLLFSFQKVILWSDVHLVVSICFSSPSL